MELCWSEWDFAFTPICQLISISRTKSDELLLMARKAVGCLVTFWLNASHALTIDRSISLARFFFCSTRADAVTSVLARTLIKFYGIFKLHKSNSVPVHNHENSGKRKKNQEMKISFIFEWNEKDQKERERKANKSISMCEFLNVHFVKKSDASADSLWKCDRYFVYLCFLLVEWHDIWNFS